MPMQEAQFIWKNGELVPWAECTTHVLSHSLQCGSAVVEDIRCYYNADKGARFVFRAKEHMQRLLRSATMGTMPVPYTADELVRATLEVLRAHELKECRVRALAYYSYGSMGPDPAGAPVEVAIACVPLDVHAGEDAPESGVSAGISSWRQASGNAIPPQMKSSASQMGAMLAKLEAKSHGHDEAILLNEQGFVCESTSGNVFAVRDGVVSTPPVSDGLLEGLTRDTVLNLAMDLELPVVEERLVRADLYSADEVFFTSTVAEVLPVASVDGRMVGAGSRGPITKAIQDRFAKTVTGELSEYSDWLVEVG